MTENEKNKMAAEYLFSNAEKLAELIEELNKSGMLKGNDQSLLFAIKRNIEFGMDQKEIIKRVMEIGRHAPKLVALLLAAGIYRYYDN